MSCSILPLSVFSNSYAFQSPGSPLVDVVSGIAVVFLWLWRNVNLQPPFTTVLHLLIPLLKRSMRVVLQKLRITVVISRMLSVCHLRVLSPGAGCGNVVWASPPACCAHRSASQAGHSCKLKETGDFQSRLPSF